MSYILLKIYLVVNFYYNPYFNGAPFTKKINENSFFDSKNQELKQNEQFESYTDNRDGKSYKIIKIGNQVWFAENLAYLPSYNEYQSSKSSPVSIVYRNNNEASMEETDFEALSQDLSIIKESQTYKKYGVLYNYTASLNACPNGWRVPSDDDWKELESFLGMNSTDLDKMGHREYRESGSVGNKLISGTEEWINLEKTSEMNLVGFNALPGGGGDLDYFYDLGVSANFWGSSSNGALACAVFRKITADNLVIRGCDGYRMLKSIRCLKN